MTDVLPWLVTILVFVILMLTLRMSRLIGKTQRTLDEVSESLVRNATRLERLNTHIDEYWRGVEARMGKIHETFESGRACRMGGTVAEVDLKMSQLNRKMDELLERMSRSGEGAEAP